MIVNHAPEQLVCGPKGHVPLIRQHCTSPTRPRRPTGPPTMRDGQRPLRPGRVRSEHVVIAYLRPARYWELGFILIFFGILP